MDGPGSGQRSYSAANCKPYRKDHHVIFFLLGPSGTGSVALHSSFLCRARPLRVCLQQLFMIPLSVAAYPGITGDPRLSHTVFGLFHPLVSHPPTVSTVERGGSELPLHRACHPAHSSAVLSLSVCVFCGGTSCRSVSTRTPG